jgi:DnaJ-class molecular chaperone
MITNYYTLLNIDQSADLYDIKKAFRNEIAIYHPDNNKSEDAQLQFDLCVEAFEILSDSEKRSAYDMLLKSQETNKPIIIEQEEEYEAWQEEAKTKSETYRASSLSDFFLLDIFAQAGFEGLIAGSEALIEGAEPLVEVLGDAIGEIIGGIFDGL